MPKQYDLFWEETPEVSEEDRKFISNRVDAIAEKIDEIDEAINKAAVKWTTDRMSKVDLTILRLAYYEMKIDEDIPEKVAVDQAIELAKKYGTDDSPSFVNGVLAKLF
jgi:N utilization substance protein B